MSAPVQRPVKVTLAVNADTWAAFLERAKAKGYANRHVLLIELIEQQVNLHKNPATL